MTAHAPEHSLALLHAPGLTHQAVTVLLKHFGNAGEVCRAAKDGALAEHFNKHLSPDTEYFLKAPSGQAYENDLRWLEKPNRHLIPITAPEYPIRLREDKSAPIALFVRGDTTLLCDPQIAIVGTRQPTPAGAEITAEFAASLGRKGLIITSGLATGVDSHAHRAALRINAPTIAAVGTGLNVCYPRQNASLAEQIAESGALVSEFPCDTPAKREHFPRRNRIISGMSLGVVVVEAGYKSGALITARLAGEQGRDVFAVPGSIRNPMARGCHRLIGQGARLVQSPDEVFEGIAGRISPEDLGRSSPGAPGAEDGDGKPAVCGEPPDKKHKQLLEQMGYDPVSPDTLVERCNQPAAEIASMLLVLELEGYVISQNGFYSRVK